MAEQDNAKAGVDFEWVNSNAKDSKGNPVKTRRFFTRAEKKAMKEGKKPETKAAPAKPANKPAKAAAPTASQRPKARPKAEPAKTNSVRPEGKPAGMPAAKPGKKDTFNLDRNLSLGALAATTGFAAAGARRNARAMPAKPKPPVTPIRNSSSKAAKPSAPFNPVKSVDGGKVGLLDRFRGRAAGAGGRGARRIGPGGRGRSDMDKAKDPLMLMAKGGMVKKKK